MSICASFPLGKQTLVVKKCNQGYDLFLSNGNDEAKVVSIKTKPMMICGQQFEFYESEVFCDRIGNSRKIELPFPGDESEDPIIQRPDGKLYCTRCGCIVPNTASCEMKKEGFYAHSHVCEKII